jgi:magnesium transporter
MGMNVIVNSATDPVFLTVLIGVMALTSVLMLIWARRRGWW